ncbi:hypothetical protein SAMN05216308_103217 [Nitrosospira sp. Nsp13]|jgi:hypothetical protein|nr:hypothetical protein SAMN05216308_103217 [Nitrosospira sp. Nsp13]
MRGIRHISSLHYRTLNVHNDREFFIITLMPALGRVGYAILGPVNTYFAPAFFCAQPEGTGRISSGPSLLAAYGGLLRRAAHASCWTPSRVQNTC